MARNTYWKGYLKLSLVTCPVALMPATSDSEKIRFHTLNRVTGNRVEARYVDAGTGKAVSDADEIKGYQTGEDTYVMLEDDELSAVALESTRTIDIETFVPQTDIGWIWCDTPYFLVPDDAVGEEAYGVIREAMSVTKTVGISRLVLNRRERAVMLEPRDTGIVLWTLRFGDEVRAADDYFDTSGGKPEKDLLHLVEKLIKARTRHWDPKIAHDPVQADLQKLVAAKKKGRKSPRAKVQETPEPASNVVNIMDALKRSLAEEKTSRR